MISNVTAVSVLWNEAHRIDHLASIITAWFEHAVIVVQDSDDDTYERVAAWLVEPTQQLLRDEWQGGGDFSMPLALEHVTTKWVFVISGDEYPDVELLRSLPACVEALQRGGHTGAFLPFAETIDGLEFVEHGEHVRLFDASGGWEARHHSAASHENTIHWRTGAIHHDRTYDEVMRDYLRKYRMMVKAGDTHLLIHQTTMFRRATELVSKEKGMEYPRQFEWYPQIAEIMGWS